MTVPAPHQTPDPRRSVSVGVLRPGRHEPLGATVRDGGVNFAVFSRHANRIELCVFDEEGVRELERLPLHGPYDGVFHGFMPGAQPGLVYVCVRLVPTSPSMATVSIRTNSYLTPARGKSWANFSGYLSTMATPWATPTERLRLIPPTTPKARSKRG